MGEEMVGERESVQQTEPSTQRSEDIGVGTGWPEASLREVRGKKGKVFAGTKLRDYGSKYSKIRQNAESYLDSHQTSMSRCGKRFRAGLHLDGDGVVGRGG